jgi:hypothetical protein
MYFADLALYFANLAMSFADLPMKLRGARAVLLGVRYMTRETTPDTIEPHEHLRGLHSDTRESQPVVR